jgi:putative membrane protein
MWNAVTAVTLVSIATLYAIGLPRVWRHSIRPWQAAAFALGLASAATALLSKLDAWSDILFSAHMTQHEILMLVTAPLMVLGRPFIVTLWALPAPARVRAGTMMKTPALQSVWERISGPFTVLILHSIVLWIWHVPALFESALHHEGLHVFQHLGFFLTAALFWWALIHGRYGKLGYGVGVLYVFATAMHTQILGALLTFTSRIWYPTHAHRTAAAGMNPVHDQQLAGVVMWIPFGVVFLIVALALFAAWLGEVERRMKLTAMLLLLFVFAGCHPRDDETAREITGGDPDRGRRMIRRYGCGACHEVPGVSGARGLVGPPLTRIADRMYLAGQLPNNPENMMKWILAPQSIEPGSAMPNLNVTDRDARDIAAYLYTLR